MMTSQLKVTQDTSIYSQEQGHLDNCILWITKFVSWNQGLSLSILLPPELLRW